MYTYGIYDPERCFVIFYCQISKRKKRQNVTHKIYEVSTERGKSDEGDGYQIQVYPVLCFRTWIETKSVRANGLLVMV